MDDDIRRQLPEPARTELERTERFAETLVGQTEEQAVDAAGALGITVRIAVRDGKNFPLRADMRFSRVNLVVEGGVVRQAVAN